MADKMTQSDRFDPVMNRLDLTCRLTNAPPPTVLMTFMHGIAKSEMNEKNGLRNLFDWHTNPLTTIKQDLCVMGIGGIALPNAQFLLKYLYSQRNMFLVALTSRNTRGWIYLLHIIWGHLIRLPQKEKLLVELG